MRAGVGAEFPEGATTYGGELAWGHQSGMFLGGVLARTSDNENSDVNAMTFGARGGYEMSFESMPRLRLCPVASLSYTNGPDLGPISNSRIGYSLGAAVGTVLPASDAIAIVPSAALSWTGARDKTEQNGASATASDSWFQARVAAGIVFNRAITIAPTVDIPFEEGAEATFGVAFSYNFGRSSGVVQQGSTKKKNRSR